MGAISGASVRQSEAQFRLKWPQTETATPLASSTPSTSTPSSSADGVTLEAVMAQFQRMDAHLDTFSDELCQVSTRHSHIARRQAHLGDSDGDDEDEDENANSSSDEEMTA